LRRPDRGRTLESIGRRRRQLRVHLPLDRPLRERAYVFGPLGVATTSPAPGSGTACTYFVSLPPIGAEAVDVPHVQGSASLGGVAMGDITRRRLIGAEQRSLVRI